MKLAKETVLSAILALKKAQGGLQDNNPVSIDTLAEILQMNRCDLYQILAQLAIDEKVVIDPFRHMGYVDITDAKT